MIQHSGSGLVSQSKQQTASQNSVASHSIPSSESWPYTEKRIQARTSKQQDEQRQEQQEESKRHLDYTSDELEIYKWEKRITLGVDAESKVSLIEYQTQILMVFGSISSEIDAARKEEDNDVDQRQILIKVLRAIDELATQMTLAGELDLIRTDNIRSNITGRSRKRFYNRNGTCKLACQRDLWRCFDVLYRITGATKHTIEVTMGFIPRLPFIRKLKKASAKETPLKKRKLEADSGELFENDDNNASDDESSDEQKRAIKRRLLDLDVRDGEEVKREHSAGDESNGLFLYTDINSFQTRDASTGNGSQS